MENDEPVVTYSLREVLDNINHKLDGVVGVVHGKADTSRVDELDARVRIVEAHIEHTKSNAADREHKREWLIPVTLTAVMTVFEVAQHVHF